jgi:hypothetical protein
MGELIEYDKNKINIHQTGKTKEDYITGRDDKIDFELYLKSSTSSNF